LQLQGELQAKDRTKRVYRGVIHGYGVILKNEGFKGLMRGLNCAVRLRPTTPQADARSTSTR
jgi:solute carrier family 25 protein 34/35